MFRPQTICELQYILQRHLGEPELIVNEQIMVLRIRGTESKVNSLAVATRGTPRLDITIVLTVSGRPLTFYKVVEL